MLRGRKREQSPTLRLRTLRTQTRAESEAEEAVNAGRDGIDIAVVGALVVVRKSAFRLVFEGVARRALQSEEVVGS